jgi:hypothetical protein
LARDQPALLLPTFILPFTVMNLRTPKTKRHASD